MDQPPGRQERRPEPATTQNEQRLDEPLPAPSNLAEVLAMGTQLMRQVVVVLKSGLGNQCDRAPLAEDPDL